MRKKEGQEGGGFKAHTQPLSVRFLWRWSRRASNVVWRVCKAQQENEKQTMGLQKGRKIQPGSNVPFQEIFILNGPAR